jgi:hypothetical protein
VDLDRLRASACDCYQIVKDEYTRFLADDKFKAMSDVRQTRVRV